MIIRTFAAGLLTTAYLLIRFPLASVKYFQDSLQKSPVLSFHFALKTLSPALASATGAEHYSLAVYLFAALGIGMAIAGIVYPIIEGIIIGAGEEVADLVGLLYKKITEKIRPRGSSPQQSVSVVD